MPALHYLTEREATLLVERLTIRLFPGTPAFQLRGETGRSLLLSALEQPRWSHHRTLPEKAAALHFFLNKAHPYTDGNKRFAVAAMEFFLYLNDAALIATDSEIEKIALGVASGEIDMEACVAFVVERTIRIGWRPAQIGRWMRRLGPESLAIVREVMRGGGSFIRGRRINEHYAAIFTRPTRPQGGTTPRST